jgi:hypothetical protein
MFIRLILAELLKYKRTFIPWMIIIGGGLAAVTSFLQVSTDYSKVTWELLAQSGFFCLNLLALLLTSIFAGIVFIGEYHEGMSGILFTYPIPRIKLYITKYVVTFLMVISLYAVFFISTVVIGLISIGSFPSSEFMVKLIKLTALIIAVNFVLLPLTALISMVIKAIGTYILVGMGYFLVYASFNSSDFSAFVPPCLSSKLAINYLAAECIKKSDYPGIIAVSLITFFCAFIIGAFYYSKCDVKQ